LKRSPIFGYQADIEGISACIGSTMKIVLVVQPPQQAICAGGLSSAQYRDLRAMRATRVAT
jgi:hypothetical protein